MQNLDPILHIVCLVGGALYRIKGIHADICIVNHNLGGLQHVQTPELSTSVSKNRHKVVYSNTSIQGLKYSTILM